jgi:hypothetical protein
VEVYPNDSIVISFRLDADSGKWTNQWITSPGPEPSAAGDIYRVTDTVVPSQDIGE